MDELRNSIYKFYTWLSISENNVKASDLNAPRVRRAPDDQTPKIDDLQIENSKFKNNKILNLPYQELNHEFQVTSFHNILQQCADSSNSNSSNLNTMHLQGNQLSDLSRFTFSKLEICYLQHNLFESFSKLPKMGQDSLQFLDLSDNSIKSFKNITTLPRSLKHLDLRRNPIAFTENYRQRVFSALPNLETLDNMPRGAIRGDEPDNENGFDEDEEWVNKKDNSFSGRLFGSKSKKRKNEVHKKRTESITSVDQAYYS